jgi:hypothetical protein
MTRWEIVLTVAGVLAVAECGRAQTPGQVPMDLGPGSQGATLRQPAMEAPAQGAPAPTTLGPWNQAVAPTAPPPPRTIQYNRVDINRDIEVTPEAGTWVLLVMSYVGPDAPVLARNFVYELRKEYKLNAYVYNYGAEEKRKAHEAAEAERQKQREALRQLGLTPDMPIRVRVEHVHEQTAVLIANNYRTIDEAKKDLTNRIRELPCPNKDKVALDFQWTAALAEGNGPPPKDAPDDGFFLSSLFGGNKKKLQKADASYVNPFKQAFAVRNPILPKEQTESNTAEELAFLRQVNSGEPFSLFNCRKKLTLVIKQFNTPVAMKDSRSSPGGGGGILGAFSKSNADRDFAAHNAHDLAEFFRKLGLPETYVLHARYCSFVTIGGYDSEQDPELVGMQRFLEGRFQRPEVRMLDLIPRPIPMQVPH